MSDNFTSPEVPIKKKRNRDPLTTTAHERLYEQTSRKNGDCYLQSNRARNDSRQQFQAMSVASKLRINKYWEQFMFVTTQSTEEIFEPENDFHQMGRL